MAHPNVEYCLKELAREIDSSPPIFNGEDRCKIYINNIPILLEASPHSPQYILLSSIYEGPLNQNILELAMAGNLYWLETGGSTLMWDKESETLLLGYEGSSDHIEIAIFKNILQNFARYTAEWRQKIKDLA